MAGITTSTTLTSQFQNFFSKELLSIVQQETILDQFATKATIPKNNGNNAIGTVLNVPDGTAVYKFTGGKYVANAFVDGAWDAPAMTLAPGEGFFINVPAATTITLIGEVSLANSTALAAGYSLLSVPVPLAGGLADAAAGGLTAAEGDVVYQWTGSGFAAKEYVDGAWAPSAPTVKVGEGFFLKGTARTYARNFSVN